MQDLGGQNSRKNKIGDQYFDFKNRGTKTSTFKKYGDQTAFKPWTIIILREIGFRFILKYELAGENQSANKWY